MCEVISFSIGQFLILIYHQSGDTQIGDSRGHDRFIYLWRRRRKNRRQRRSTTVDWPYLVFRPVSRFNSPPFQLLSTSTTIYLIIAPVPIASTIITVHFARRLYRRPGRRGRRKLTKNKMMMIGIQRCARLPVFFPVRFLPCHCLAESKGGFISSSYSTVSVCLRSHQALMYIVALEYIKGVWVVEEGVYPSLKWAADRAHHHDTSANIKT